MLNIKNSIFEMVVKKVFGESTGDGYIFQYNSRIEKLSIFYKQMQTLKDLNTSKELEYLASESVSRQIDITSLENFLDAIGFEYTKTTKDRAFILEETITIKKRSVESVHKEYLSKIKTKKEKDEFIKASLIGDSDMSTLTEELSILEMEKESIDLEKRKLSRHSETLRESIHMTKKILDKRGGGFQC